MTQSVISSLRSVDKNQLGHQAGYHSCPDKTTHHVGMAWLDQSQSTNGVTDTKVAVHTDASEKQDAAVQVSIEKKPDNLTEKNPKRPVAAVCVVVYEHRQGEHVERVRQGQMEHINRTWFPGPHLSDEHP